MKKRRAEKAFVEWRDGVHLVGTPIWCDARRAREACFVSSALVGEVRKHKQVIATAETLALLDAPIQGLPVTYGRPFTLGDVRLELFPSGHAVGAASLAASWGEARVVYAGVVHPRGAGLAQHAEVRACDVLVVDGSCARPGMRFPPAAQAMSGALAFVLEALAAGATPVLLVTPHTTGVTMLRALADLTTPGVSGVANGGTVAVRAHRAVVDVARKLKTLGRDVPVPKRFAGQPAPGEVVLWPAGLRDAAALGALRRRRTAAVGTFSADGVDARFLLADCADHDALREYIHQSGARKIHLLRADEATAKAFGASLMGPPQQLALF